MVIVDFTSDTEKFALDGTSSDSLGLFCDYLPPMPLAEQKYTDFNVGEDEQKTTPDDVYNNITYKIRFYTFLPDDLNDSAIKAFCFNKSILTLSRFPGYYFKIRKTSLQASDGTNTGKRVDYTLTLVLAPFKYITDNQQITLSDGDIIANNYTRYSKPLFEITGTGDIKLTVNDVDFTVAGLSSGQTIYIDSTRHITYSGATLLTGKTNGAYPLLNVGNNTVSWTGTITSVKYNGNWRDL